jgi:hypothetical protein
VSLQKTIPWMVLALALALAPETRADFNTCSVPWTSFSPPNGFTSEYTSKGETVRDNEAPTGGGDPSNGGTAVNPAEVDLASGSPGAYPGNYATPAFGYYDGGTVWDATEPSSMADDHILFRWRLVGDPKTSQGDYSAYHWNVLFDVDGDGYKEYWVDLEGACVNSDCNGSPAFDRVQILYDNANRQDIADPNAARVNQFRATENSYPGSCGAGSPGQSHSRLYCAGTNGQYFSNCKSAAAIAAGADGTGDYMLEVQIPMTAFKDLSGNQVVYPDSPIAFAYSTSASNTNPLQKDFMQDLKFTTLEDPIEFGDIVTPSGYPAIQFVDANNVSRSYYTAGENVYLYLTDPRANTSSSTIQCLNVTVTNPATGDDEIVRMCETTPSSGVFTNQGGKCASVLSPTSSPVKAWLTDVRLGAGAIADETWTLTYSSATSRWQVAGSVSGLQAATAAHAVAYTSNSGGLSFTLYQDAPANGTTMTFCTLRPDPLPTSTTTGTDEDGTLHVNAGDRIYVGYTNAQSITVNDEADILGPTGDTTPTACSSAALLQFTRNTGLPTGNYQLKSDPSISDKVYVTLTHLAANTNATTVQTVTVALTGNDTQTLTLTETGVNTGIFRNTTGLNTKISDGTVTANDGLWEDTDLGALTVTYSYVCGGVAYQEATTATVFTAPGGGRVEFTDGGGTQDVTLYAPGQPVFLKVTDATATCPGPLQVTVTTTSGDSETLTLNQTAAGSGVFMNERYDLNTTAGSASVTSATGGFSAALIGARLAIGTGPDAGLYTVTAVASATALTLDRALTATRPSGIYSAASYSVPALLAATLPPGPTANNGIVEATHGDTFTVSYTDCSDGDSDTTNNVKTDTARYNDPPLVINRVMFWPQTASSCQTEFVELYNSSNIAHTATGYRVLDEDAQLDFTIPQLNGSDIVLQAGQKVIVWIGGYFTNFYDATNGIYYVFISNATYPSDILGDPGTAYASADKSDQILLLAPNGQIVDYVGWSATTSPSVDFLGDDSAAVLRSIWQDDSFRGTAAMIQSEVMQRSGDGFDTNRPTDWAFGSDTTCTELIEAWALTRATLQGLRVDPAGVVEFATSTQRGTASFQIHALSARGGKRPIGKPVRARVPDSMNPVVYRVQTGPIAETRILIEETDVHGRNTWMGPFPVGDGPLAEAFEAVSARLERAHAPAGDDVRMARGRAQRLLAEPAAVGARGPVTVPRGKSGSPVSGVRIDVASRGIVEVPLETLQAWGMPGNAARVTFLGREVPHWYVPQARSRGAIAFRAETLSTDQTALAPYIVSWTGSALAPSVPLTSSAEPTTPGFVRIERSLVYRAMTPLNADPWTWDMLGAGWGQWPFDWWDPTLGDFDLPDLVPGSSADVQVRLKLRGDSAATHRVDATINGHHAGSVTFEGFADAVLMGSVPASALRTTGNQMRLDYMAEGGTGWDMALIDYLEIAAPTGPGNRPATVARIAGYDPALPAAPQTQYLIVTHPAFLDAAHRIAAYKQAEGLDATVVDVERAYDRFSAGVPEPRAVQAMIRQFARTGRLKYVLLVGDDTLDPRNGVGTGAVSYVPSMTGWDGNFGRVPSETPYADVNGDGKPDLAIGRLPVQTAEEAVAMAEKIGRQAASLAASAGRHLFAVDNQNPRDIQFLAQAQRTSQRLPADSSVAWARLDDGVDTARAALLKAWNEGTTVTHYFGHGGPTTWADEALLSAADGPALQDSRETVLLTWACQTQFYQYLWGPTVSESVLLLPRGGAVASFGPTGITTPAEQRAFYERFYATGVMAGRVTLGEAIQRAKARMLTESPSTRGVVDGWSLLGDPALRLPARPAAVTTSQPR